MTEETENIPQANELLYCLKLTTGEEILCTLISEERTYVVIESPVQVKVYPMMGENGEVRNELSTNMWMPFAKDRLFNIPYSCIMILAAMDSMSQKLYTKMVNRFETRTEEVPEPSAKSFFVNTSESIQ